MPLDPATAHAVHALFEALAIALGVRCYLGQRATGSVKAPFAVLAGCLLGAAIGNKAAFWLEMPELFSRSEGWMLLLTGQSIVGGLLGGLIGVEAAKLLSGQRASTGDRFVFPLLLAIGVGRIGCFLAGLNDATYGLPTTLPWGVDFGDGLPRHPTQLYEIVFCIALAAVLARWRAPLAATPGLRFKLMLSTYLLWRLGIDTIKPVHHPWPLGLSGIQWLCLAALSIYLPLTLRQLRRHARVPQESPMALL